MKFEAAGLLQEYEAKIAARVRMAGRPASEIAFLARVPIKWIHLIGTQL
jgi:hypothetical protein